MGKLGRREFLLGLGAGSALAALHPTRLSAVLRSDAAAPGLQAVNVLIHGMFAVDVEAHTIVLYPPKTAGHDYKAGNRNAPHDLIEGKHYRLMGLRPNSRLALAQLHPREVAVFPRHKIDTSLAYCEIVLPKPDKVTPLRSLHADPGQPFFEGTPKPYEEPKSLPDVLVLTYDHVTGPVHLATGFPWTPIPHYGIANLNFWAMPANNVPSSHATSAFAALAAMVEYPHLAINSHYAHTHAPPVDAHPGVPGVTSADERGLGGNKLHANPATCASYCFY